MSGRRFSYVLIGSHMDSRTKVHGVFVDNQLGRFGLYLFSVAGTSKEEVTAK